jgi:hypothetical protein
MRTGEEEEEEKREGRPGEGGPENASNVLLGGTTFSYSLWKQPYCGAAAGALVFPEKQQTDWV